MLTLFASVPVVAVITILALRLNPLFAASLGCAIALVTSALIFPISESTLTAKWGEWTLLLGEVLAIVGGGLLLSHLMKASGRQRIIANWLTRSLGSGVPAVLSIVHA